MTDPRTGFQRGCNNCWENIQDTIKDWDEKEPPIDDLEPTEISLEEIEDYDGKRTDRDSEDDES